MQFQPEKYLGLWYELIHYASWFERQDAYNTTAEYSLNSDGSIGVHNTTIIAGQLEDIRGRAVIEEDVPFNDGTLPIASLKVSFPGNESHEANYLIHHLLTNDQGDYIYSIVTNANKDSLFVLSRFPDPDLVSFNILIEYIKKDFDLSQILHVPHYSYKMLR